ncbi:hypothetical protein Pmani_014974 [Petrolisthes manimaculis]|uniref:SSD domain-containing protein n=1 Tax=Petrolisthes manimaculis TaxID=1843537 RepID=A0AAE1UC26_9EUCA|nr:hypothetical protein Pmani_014974 [Petrolisthes manimaculis]
MEVTARYGLLVASHPIRFILGCVCVTAICSLGFLNFTPENRPEKLWIPQNSDFVKILEWQKQNFPPDQRFEMVMYEAENVLTAQYVREMYHVHNQIRSVQITGADGKNYTQDDLCFRVPALGGKQSQKLLEFKTKIFPDMDPHEELDWSLAFKDKNIYYQFYTCMPTACLEESILEMWGYDTDVIHSLTDADVVNAINTVNMSATFSYPLNFTEYLSGVERNTSGHITSARTALTRLIMQINSQRVDANFANNAGLSEGVDPELYTWEGKFIQALDSIPGTPQGLQIYYYSQRSFAEISSDTIFGDVTYLTVGFIILFIYVQLMLGKFNMVENRPGLSLMGMLATFMAVVVAFGLCSGLGLIYGPVHTILPLLLLGLGVDDMFVFMQCWNTLDHQECQQELHKRVGQALRHAGVAITVTSLTDFAAFFIGATTVLPALRSFCIYSAVGVVTLYIFQATFFVAWFTLDQRRLEDTRNGLFWCYKHKNWKPNSCSQFELCQTFFEKVYSKNLIKKPVKVLVLVATAGLLGGSIWSVTNLRQDFDPIQFIPHSSYLYQFLSRLVTAYPQTGERGTVYMGALNYSQELYKVGELMEEMQENPYVSSVDSWYNLMADYTLRDTGEDIRGKALNDTFFSEAISVFLFSPVGTRFQTYFHFDGNLTIARPAPRVMASKFDYIHRTLVTRGEELAAMDEVKYLVRHAGFSDMAGASSFVYSGWETNKVIMVELIRNLLLAMVAVLVMTLILIADILTSSYVLLSVCLTLLNVMALMTWWDLEVDIITCINLVLSIGLCVDYSAHIALHFMQVRGTRDERARVAVSIMGPPVINGAFSTFLSFSFLWFSDSYVFLSFFKIFFGVFVFGVFNGLVFLPVLLSVVGPPPYAFMKSSTPPVLEPSATFSSDTQVKIKTRSEKKQTYVAVPGD